MGRIGISILTILLLTLLAAVSVRADHPHFVEIGVKFANNSPNLIVSFKETGLGDVDETTNYQVTGNAGGFVQCTNGASASFPNGPVFFFRFRPAKMARSLDRSRPRCP